MIRGGGEKEKKTKWWDEFVFDKKQGGEVGTKLNLSSLCTQVSRNGQREVCANDVVFCWRMVGMMHQERGFHSNPIINY